ncbi:hypothetical protein [Nibricoccus sp. IMCC34717]|uniref:hypothetical protein n=1 Tax=Nibricoccus sp. IMCC34717 TaxID=3034021 RepID=UPI00384F5875
MSKKSNSRSCPALGKSISSKQCGEERHRLIPCPEACEFNPFSRANYEPLDCETAAIHAFLDWLAAGPRGSQREAAAAILLPTATAKASESGRVLNCFNVAIRLEPAPQHSNLYEEWWATDAQRLRGTPDDWPTIVASRDWRY